MWWMVFFESNVSEEVGAGAELAWYAGSSMRFRFTGLLV
jgi:hypothetical protein